MRGDRYQIALITLGVVSTILYGWFFIRELFPEYKIYQNAYVALEQFRSSYTGVPPPSFTSGIKQIVLERKDLGPSTIDRCTSCHVALQFQHFSPTQIAVDVNGNTVLDEEGFPKKEPNPNYVWAKLDQKIADLTDPVANEKLASEGKQSQVNARLEEAAQLEKLKTAKDGEHVWNMAKVLQMHPLMGSETRPFEFHPIDEYGCTSCHSGNGRGLTTMKAHGPVFDRQYEEEDIGPVPTFLEPDEENDPRFSKVFNGKPSHELLFQTTPILVGALMEAKCVQCHQTSQSTQQQSIKGTADFSSAIDRRTNKIGTSFERGLNALISEIQLKLKVENLGAEETVKQLRLESEDYSLSQNQRKILSNQADLITLMVGGADGLRKQNAQPAKDVVVQKLNERIESALGSKELASALQTQVDPEGVDVAQIVNQFIRDHKAEPEASGSLFVKARSVDRIENEKDSYIPIEVDLLTQNFHQGEQLFINQACYACHRITGFARGGVGPEVTEIGLYYPWYIKESIVWPQADLKTSTMPNYGLDHEELEDLVTFLLAQRGPSKLLSSADYKKAIMEWDAGKKLPWELPTTPAEMHDVNYGLTIFATEGCAACHRLQGFSSDVGFAIEKKEPDFDQLYQAEQWFARTIPETISGSDLVSVLKAKAEEIDSQIVDGVRSGSIIEKIEESHPGNLESFYSNFKYAMRARNHELKDNPEELKAWKERVRRTLMMYVTQYGYGRIVGPRPNWSGIYRSDEWLMNHFHKPSAEVARSIMPVLPFNDTKFYALTYMLNVVGKRNRDANRKLWNERGFNPETAYNLYCAQCHGDQRVGNGPVAEWIYPVPKNLRNADFMRNLTPERARRSIMHGVAGGPMPPWGEAPAKASTGGIPVLTSKEVDRLVDWMFSDLPGSTVIQTDEDVPKWDYDPEDVIEDLKREGTTLDQKSPLSMEFPFLEKGSHLLASLEAMPTTDEVSQIFDIKKDPFGDKDDKLYFIKRKYYTPQNLDAGRQYFELHCASCHGREGDGAGARAGVMQDAKPRMLINFPWIETRDDLRLIRSIKFGVSGTSMQPWGDQTSALQRMQLVMYIRSLSSEQDYRNRLYEALYKNFEESRVFVENVRISKNPSLIKTANELKKVTQSQFAATQKVKLGTGTAEEAAALYQKQLELSKALREKESIDSKYQALLDLIYQERKIYEEIGLGMIALHNRDQVFDPYMQLLDLKGQLIGIKDGYLVASAQDTKDQEALIKNFESELGKNIQAQEENLTHLQGKIASPEVKEQIQETQSNIQNLKKLRNSIISGAEEAKRLERKQNEILNELKNEMSNDNSNSGSPADSSDGGRT